MQSLGTMYGIEMGVCLVELRPTDVCVRNRRLRKQKKKYVNGYNGRFETVDPMIMFEG